MINLEKNKETFLKILQENLTRDGSQNLINWIQNSTFFTDPSAKAHHGNFDGGLCDHSLKVYETLKRFIALYQIDFPEYNVAEETIVIASLLHDLCKVGLYKKGFRNVKNDETGQWERKPRYDYSDTLGMGHGEASVYMIQSFIHLTREEALAIRHHMGAYDSAFKGGDNSINVARSQSPIVTLLHMADTYSSQFLEETV